MAENKEKKVGFFKRVFSRLVKSIRDMRGEIKKVVWPSRKTITNNAVVVIVACVVLGAFLWAVDSLLGGLVNLILSSAG